MNDSIEATGSSLAALSRQYQAIAHNLANASTAGYKRRLTTFTQAMRQAIGSADGLSGATDGNVSGQTVIDFTQGLLDRTGAPLDLGLQGEGFFVVNGANGPLYTRDGTLKLNANRQLVDPGGRMFAGEGGPISLPGGADPSMLQISPEGVVVAAGQEVGKLRIVEFDDPSQLVPAGGNCFQAPTGAAPAPATDTRVHQGFRESPNLSVPEELVGLITVTRLYEANIKSIRTQDERMKQIIQVAMS